MFHEYKFYLYRMIFTCKEHATHIGVTKLNTNRLIDNPQFFLTADDIWIYFKDFIFATCKQTRIHNNRQMWMF